MKKKEAGQAFILALIILAIGTLMVVPSLRLMDTSLKSHNIVASQQRGFYVAEAAQQKIQWMLLHDNLTDNFSNDGDTENLTVDVCDYVANVTVVMRAIESEEGIILALDDTIMPTKTVSPNTIAPADNPKDPRYFYYEISLTQVSCDNTRDLVGIWDVLPTEFDFADDIYVPGSSEISIDGGEWQQIGDPLLEEYNRPRFHWPGPGDSFTPDFTHFEPAQVNKLRFQIYSGIARDDLAIANWVVLQVGDSYTLSGPQAIINVGTPEVWDACETDGMFRVDKTADPLIIPPLVSTEVAYTITITNMDAYTRSFIQVDDYLPPGFEYVGPTNGATVLDPHSETLTLNGVERKHLWWDEDQLTSSGISIGACETVTMTFIASALQPVSGTYYNEVTVKPKSAPTPPQAFTTITGSRTVDVTGADITVEPVVGLEVIIWGTMPEDTIIATRIAEKNPEELEFEGVIESFTETTWVVTIDGDSRTVDVTGAYIEGEPVVGLEVKIWGTVLEDTIIPTLIEVKGSEELKFEGVIESFTETTWVVTTGDDFDWNSAFVQAYSWNSGAVIIPAYDTKAEADGEIIDANYGLWPGGVTVNSWHVR